MKPKFLFLFDIDGTLLNAGDLSVSAYTKAFINVIGVSLNIREVECSGRTDPYIVKTLLKKNKKEKYIQKNYLDTLYQEFQKNISDMVDNGKKANLLNGVNNTLKYLEKQSNAGLGIITGNLEKGAKSKLRAAGINKYFTFGAYGSDEEDRNKLGPIAIKRAQELYNTNFENKNIYIIGDSVHDIKCAKASKVNIIAISSGVESYSNLVEYAPDILIKEMDHKIFKKIIEN